MTRQDKKAELSLSGVKFAELTRLNISNRSVLTFYSVLQKQAAR